MRLFEALPAIRSSKFDLPLTYDAGDLDLQVGDIVRVPLGSRDVIAFVVTPVSVETPVSDVTPSEAFAKQTSDTGAGKTTSNEKKARQFKRVLEKCDAPRAFDETGLHLAQFIAERYICTLGEALSAVVLASAIPRMADSFERTAPRANAARYPSVPERLLSLIWDELPESFGLEVLLRHRDARRTGDRSALLRHIQTLTRSGDLRRVRRFVAPKMQTYMITALFPAQSAEGEKKPRGKKIAALVEYVREQPGVHRADALLAGFSHAIIRRAIKTGLIHQKEIEPVVTPNGASSFARRAVEMPPPTLEQATVLEQIDRVLRTGDNNEFLLYGITGSGKTYVYIEAIQHVVREGGRAIVLVPEISLTPQTARRFELVFGERVAVLHSALSERERFDAWQACMRGDVDVIVGARSAVFAPLPNVRLIVVDEAHETTYKQDTSPRYNAVTVARERMRHAKGTIILGSATPSLESWSAAKTNALKLLMMRERATQQPLPTVHVVNMSEDFQTGERRAFSPALTQAIGDRLGRNEKIVLFVNRRGSSKFLLCRSCGYVPACRRCSVSLAVHKDERLLRCHYCDLQQQIPPLCPNCGAGTIKEFGIGTEKVVEEVQHLFPSARIVRMDSDTTTRIGDHARLLTEFEEEADVLVGTQMVAKGLDYPTVTLVGVVAADIGLHMPDFRASERTFDLITQVCGRSGRARPGEAIVQTYTPNHPAIRHAASHDYETFAEEELEERRNAGFPPARRLIYLGVISRNRAKAKTVAQKYADTLAESDLCEILGPAPYPIAQLNNEWRYRIMLRTNKARALRDAIREHILPLARADRTTRVAITVDP